MRFFSFALLLLPLSVHSALDNQFVVSPVTRMSEIVESLQHAQPTLADLLTIERSASIFFSYARETGLNSLFSDETAMNTILVPTNKAVMALAKKPHQDPSPVEHGIEISEQEFDSRSKKNVEKWVSLHIIPESPISLLGHTYPTLIEGKYVTFTEVDDGATAPEWARVLLNGDVRILEMKEASNGVLYLIDGTVSDD